MIDIPTHKAGLLRSNQKFAFPCDNSIIRIDKYQVAGRRFGSTVICKDNLVFGIKEDPDTSAGKVAGEDELPNLEARKASNRDCEFWLEFENKARLHIAMLEPAEPEKDLVPRQSNDEDRQRKKQAELGSVESVANVQVDEGTSRVGGDSQLAGPGGDPATIDSALRDSKEKTET